MKVKIVAILTLVILLLASVPVYAMTNDEFFDTYDYEYKYMIKYSDGVTNYISSENPVTFSMSKYRGDGKQLKSGNSLVVNYTGTLYRLKGSGTVSVETAGTIYILHDTANLIGFSYVDIYRRSGDSFFLPNDLKLSPFRQILAGLIPLLGCLILGISLRKGWAFLQGQLRH